MASLGFASPFNTNDTLNNISESHARPARPCQLRGSVAAACASRVPLAESLAAAQGSDIFTHESSRTSAGPSKHVWPLRLALAGAFGLQGENCSHRAACASRAIRTGLWARARYMPACRMLLIGSVNAECQKATQQFALQQLPTHGQLPASLVCTCLKVLKASPSTAIDTNSPNLGMRPGAF